MNILILGCGQIGSRHIESLAKSRNKLTIYAIDKSDESIIRTKKIFNNAIKQSKQVNLVIKQNIAEVQDKIDLVIIASNSTERPKLIRGVLDNLNPNHIILEKILFRKIEDYKKFEKIFQNINTKIWVNQYMGYEFSFLSEFVNVNDKLKMKVYGNWGLCCNSVHFIEIFHYLCGRIPLKIKKHSLSDILKDSKRKDYYELYGKIKFTSSKSDELVLECNPDVPENIIKIDLYSDSKQLKDIWVDEYHNYEIKSKDDYLQERYYVRRQSERTLEIVESLMNKNSCNLPTYEHSAYHHLLILKLFKDKFEQLGIDTRKGIPIT